MCLLWMPLAFRRWAKLMHRQLLELAHATRDFPTMLQTMAASDVQFIGIAWHQPVLLASSLAVTTQVRQRATSRNPSRWSSNTGE